MSDEVKEEVKSTDKAVVTKAKGIAFWSYLWSN